MAELDFLSLVIVVPADPNKPVVVPGAAKADVVVVTAPKLPKLVVAGLLKADAPKPDGAVVLKILYNQ